MKVCHLCGKVIFAVIDDKPYCEECYVAWLRDFKSEWDK